MDCTSCCANISLLQLPLLLLLLQLPAQSLQHLVVNSWCWETDSASKSNSSPQTAQTLG
jgi:hypothetical protein